MHERGRPRTMWTECYMTLSSIAKGSMGMFVVVLLVSRCVVSRYLFHSLLQNLLQPRLVDNMRRIR